MDEIEIELHDSWIERSSSSGDDLVLYGVFQCVAVGAGVAVRRNGTIVVVGGAGSARELETEFNIDDGAICLGSEFYRDLIPTRTALDARVTLWLISAELRSVWQIDGTGFRCSLGEPRLGPSS